MRNAHGVPLRETPPHICRQLAAGVTAYLHEGAMRLREVHTRVLQFHFGPGQSHGLALHLCARRPQIWL